MENNGKFIVIEPDLEGNALTIEFNVQRGLGAATNSANINLYNLNKRNRLRIFQDKLDFSKYRPVILEVGYNGSLTTIFKGNLYQAQLVKNGTNYITQILAKDGGFDISKTQTTTTLNKGVSLKELYDTLIGDFPNIKKGIVGGEDIIFQRPVVLNGNTWDLIQNYANNSANVDLEKVYILNPKQAIEGKIPLINSVTGLLEAPRRQDASLLVKTLLEPQIVIGQIIELNSEVLPIYDGQYKVYGVNHRGVVSGAMGGNFETELNLFLGSQVYGSYDIVG
jgi:hypothetical protein